jgi:hypothetical protein
MAWENRIVAPTAQLTYWGAQSLAVGTVLTDAGAANLGCNRCMMIFTRVTPTGTREDVMTLSFHIAKTAGALFSAFTSTADLNAALAIVTNWWGTLKATSSAQVTCREVRWYQQFWSSDLTGPAIRIDADGRAGSVATSRMPDQIASTVTLKTASRRHWGRVYIPGITRADVDTTYGRLTSAKADAIALATETLKNALTAGGFELLVWSPTAHSALTIAEIHCDDVVDIVRRRRAKQTNYIKSYVA